MERLKEKKPAIELNDQFKRALELLENTNKNIFITGKAGTGKSTLLELFRSQTKKKLVVLAPTGVAALNVKGQTIHSFFGFRPDVTVQRIKKLGAKDRKASTYKKLECIVIDEISMVRADLLDCVDKFMRLNGKDDKKPFGGVQMVFIGDLYQLPPVVAGNEREMFQMEYRSPYFFSAHVFEGHESNSMQLDIENPDAFRMEFLELQKIYRQQEREFISLLNAIRDNSVTAEQIEFLNSRHLPDFAEAGKAFCIYLTTTNALAEEINQAKLNDVKKSSYKFTGTMTGDFDFKHLPTALELEIKAGAQVMMLNNDMTGRWVNGSIGQVKKVKTVTVYDEELETEGEVTVIEVKLSDGKTVEVEPFTWEMYDYYFDQDKGYFDAKTVGTFTQYPMKLAWAVTIHKSQGKTFDRVILDIGNGAFAHGQVYVALSRCTSFEGLVLKKPIQKRHVFMDWQVAEFMSQYQSSGAGLSLQDKIRKIEEAIEYGQALEIIYRGANGEESRRVITPRQVGEMEYLGRRYIGVEAYCHGQQEPRVFRVDRIITMAEAE